LLFFSLSFSESVVEVCFWVALFLFVQELRLFVCVCVCGGGARERGFHARVCMSSY
jgi:hypothetical protein